MLTKALLPDTIRAIKLASKISVVKKSYLAGGTALALHLAHRYSFDLDFFTSSVFDENVLQSELKTLTEYKEDGTGWRTVWGKIGNTKFSLFYYEYPLIKKPVDFEGVAVLQKEDILAMKIHAIEDRGTKRDFFDLFFLLKEFSMEDALLFYDKKYNCLKTHIYIILRSLNYFDEAELEREDPKMLIKTTWEEVKKFFMEQTKTLAKEKLGI